ncbi:sporulation protein YpjB [Virgibacillus sp. C22-A2]|uniref:Sporulation protein YpjB n=1 Tax=Virgibacillus tibetensis TaxID=3042313 RepID=A0ABU6KD92_9BACI|nr:sporulation protein YpjB [Virgibacillus sp. C22-A2]
MSKKGKVCVALLLLGAAYLGIRFFLGYDVFSSIASYAASDSSVTKEDKSSQTSLLWIVATVGGCIAFTLSYVSWRKYKGEEKKRLKKDKLVD